MFLFDCVTLSLKIFRSSHRPNLSSDWHPPPVIHHPGFPLLAPTIEDCLYFRLTDCFFFDKLELARNPRTKDFLLFLILLSCSARSVSVPIWRHWACQPCKADNVNTMLGIMCERVHCFCLHVSVHCMCMCLETGRSLGADTGLAPFRPSF